MQFRTQSLSITRLSVVLAVTLTMLMMVVSTARAHTRVEAGAFLFIIGWENEPVIVGERNALRIEITRDGVPVSGAEGGLDLTVFYGGRSFIGQLAPAPEAGVYLVEIFPTVRGQYELQVVGEIDGAPVEFLVEPEEVLPADVLQFPEVLPDTGNLQREIETLQADLAGARTLALAGVGLGAAGLLAGAASLWFGGKRK